VHHHELRGQGFGAQVEVVSRHGHPGDAAGVEALAQHAEAGELLLDVEQRVTQRLPLGR